MPNYEYHGDDGSHGNINIPDHDPDPKGESNFIYYVVGAILWLIIVVIEASTFLDKVILFLLGEGAGTFFYFFQLFIIEFIIWRLSRKPKK
ncbi:MAG: hypothetical protein K0S41_3457 [Anaerocolumna sp.]|nr:hypothetical protein [Anaerocolumna sp.]